ncbi:Arginyl-tRNA synthetase [Pseudoloma neurophilia]|uniref:arginine--tRNA ligase n=1 Tax=Pseudoloma neurophilia TaxID=146866 RepID=A0A0R0M0T1_9MICR|nr:Arginyl-tRNA synthetase [Pseudoloma neurophilia]
MTKFQSFDIFTIREQLIEKIKNCTELETEEIDQCLEITRNSDKSDFTLQLGKIAKQKPQKVKNIMIKEDDSLIKQVIKQGLAHHITLNKQKISEQIVQSILKSEIFDYDKNASNCNYYGSTNKGNGETAIIEHSSPNIAKKFHAGHLRTSIIGNSLVQLYKFLNFNVVRINHLGDWGKQFGLVGIGYDKYGDEKLLKEDPIKHLLDVYIKINQDLEKEVEILEKERSEAVANQEIFEDVKKYERLDKLSNIDKEAKLYFSNLEKGCKKEVEQWSHFRQLSLDQYSKLYKILNIEFDDQLGESYYALQGLDQLLNDADIDEKGNYIYKLGTLGNCVVKKENGSTLYSSRDIAAIEYRIKTYKPKIIVYVVASQQEVHFKRLFAIANGEYGYKNRAGDCKLVHIGFGMVKGFSTRKGNLVFLEDIINEAKDAMHETMKENVEKYSKIEDSDNTALQLAVSALIIQDLSAKRIKDYNFDIKRYTSYEGHTGPYLQYTHCRLVSIQKKNENITPLYDSNCLSGQALSEQISEISLSGNSLNENVYSLIFNLSKFTMVLDEFYETFEPCKLVTYLMSLSKQINSLFQSLRVFGVEGNLAKSRLAVFESARIIICNGMKLLGIVPLERM